MKFVFFKKNVISEKAIACVKSLHVVLRFDYSESKYILLYIYTDVIFTTFETF